MTNKKSRENLYIQVFIHRFLDEHLLAELGPYNTHTLLGLSMFLPNVYPSQRTLAHVLGLSRSSANKRVQDLLNFRHKSSPIIAVKKNKSKGKFANNEYKFLQNCGIDIFNSVLNTPYMNWYKRNDFNTNNNNNERYQVYNKNKFIKAKKNLANSMTIK